LQIQTPLDGDLLCEVCGFTICDLFGYFNKDTTPHWRWFCTSHRPGQWFADKRIKRLPNPDGEEGGR
jgi:hypothetical protein